MNPKDFSAEIKRRNVLRTAGLYLVGAWLLVQVAGTLLPVFDAPAWVMKTLVGLLAIGFVPALIFSWVFELTPQGLKRDEDVRPEESIAPQTARRMNRTIAAVLVLALGYFAIDKFVLTPRRDAALVAATKKSMTVTTSQESKPAASPKSVAVLAFANLSDDKGSEYFSDGISEELLNVLAKVPKLKVAARTSSFYFKGRNVPIAEIAKQLGVAYVVEGSVRKSGTKVRITAQLIKAEDGFHVWSDDFDRELKDIFAVQDEIAGLIAKNLQLKMGVVSASHREVNPEAYRLVLEGRYFWNLRGEQNFDRAEAAFRQALQIDPDFAEAHAGLADLCAVRASWRMNEGRGENTADDLANARLEIQRALALDPDFPGVFPTLGYLSTVEGRWTEAKAQFDRAVTLNPNYATARHWRALAFAGMGRLDNALAELEQAERLDPLSFTILNSMTRHLIFAGRFDDALRACDRVLALRPDFIQALGSRAVILLSLGRRDEAVVTARAVLSAPDTTARWNSDVDALYVLRETGHQAEAAELIGKLLPRWPQDSYVRGWIMVQLGRPDEGWTNVGRTPPAMALLLYWSPVWDASRDRPEFQQALAKAGFAHEYQVARETLARMRKERGAKK